MKPFKTYEEQILILKSRNLIIEDVESTIKILAAENYYNIINGYKYPFLDKSVSDDYFVENCTFNEIYALYDFDRSLRNIIFKFILQVENALRTQISYVFSKYHSSQNYLCYENFETLLEMGDPKPLMDQATKIYNLLSCIQQDISKSIKYKEYIRHYVLDYGYVPMWVLVNAIPLNRLSLFYKLMKQKERIEVSQYWGIMEKDLRQYISLLAFFRNLCAHDERIYCAKSDMLIPDTDTHSYLKIKKDGRNNYIVGKNDLFALIITLKNLLSKDDFNILYNKVNGRIISLKTKLSCIDVTSILENMGFPDNWNDIKKS